MNLTIYVSEKDRPIIERAKKLAKGQFSRIVVQLFREWLKTTPICPSCGQIVDACETKDATRIDHSQHSPAQTN
jgi:uncharacterized protein (DUF983 family)